MKDTSEAKVYNKSMSKITDFNPDLFNFPEDYFAFELELPEIEMLDMKQFEIHDLLNYEYNQ